MDKYNFATPNVTDTWSTNREGRTTGDIRWVNNKGYRWVRNDTTVALVNGRAYYFGTASVTDEFGFGIFTFGQATKGTAINLLAGIAVSAIPIGYYGWLQCYGEKSDVGVEGTVAVAAAASLKGVSGQTYLILDTATGVAPAAGKRTVTALAAQGSAGVTATRCFIDCI